MRRNLGVLSLLWCEILGSLEEYRLRRPGSRRGQPHSAAQAIDLPDVVPGSYLRSYRYFVSERSSTADQGFTVFFDFNRFASLKSPPPAVNPDWNASVLQPDHMLPADGIYDTRALVNGASLQDPCVVNFVFLGPGVPGSQPSTVNKFDANGALVEIEEVGETTTIPEPGTLVPLITGLGIACAAKRRPR